MAEICEICFKTITRWKDTDGNVRYEEVILCKSCYDKVEELHYKYQGKKSFEKCIKEIKNEQKNKRSN